LDVRMAQALRSSECAGAPQFAFDLILQGSDRAFTFVPKPEERETWLLLLASAVPTRALAPELTPFRDAEVVIHLMKESGSQPSAEAPGIIEKLGGKMLSSWGSLGGLMEWGFSSSSETAAAGKEPKAAEGPVSPGRGVVIGLPHPWARNASDEQIAKVAAEEAEAAAENVAAATAALATRAAALEAQGAARAAVSAIFAAAEAKVATAPPEAIQAAGEGAAATFGRGATDASPNEVSRPLFSSWAAPGAPDASEPLFVSWAEPSWAAHG